LTARDLPRALAAEFVGAFALVFAGAVYQAARRPAVEAAR